VVGAELTGEAANSDEAQRPLDKSPHLAASWSHVETRQVRNDYTLRVDEELDQIERPAMVSGLRGADVRVEKRLEGSRAVRFGERYLTIRPCAVAEKTQVQAVKAGRPRRPHTSKRDSDWNQNFDLKKAPRLGPAAQAAGYPRSGTE